MQTIFCRNGVRPACDIPDFTLCEGKMVSSNSLIDSFNISFANKNYRGYSVHISVYHRNGVPISILNFYKNKRCFKL